MHVTFQVLSEPLEDIYLVKLHPVDARRLPGNAITRGTRSRLLAHAGKVDDAAGTLTAHINDLTVLSVGSVDAAFVIYAPEPSSGTDDSDEIIEHGPRDLGPQAAVHASWYRRPPRHCV